MILRSDSNNRANNSTMIKLNNLNLTPVNISENRSIFDIKSTLNESEIVDNKAFMRETETVNYNELIDKDQDNGINHNVK